MSEKFIVVVLPPGWAKQVTKRLDRIERALRINRTEQEHDMAELDDRLADIAAGQDAEHAQLARLIQDFENAPGTINDAQRAVLDQIKAHIVGDTAAIVDADPEPAPVDGTPVDEGVAPGE